MRKPPPDKRYSNSHGQRLTPLEEAVDRLAKAIEHPAIRGEFIRSAREEAATHERDACNYEYLGLHRLAEEQRVKARVKIAEAERLEALG